MVEAGTLCVNADVAKLAGLYAHATAVAEAATNVYIKIAEGFICANAKYDYVTNYASVSTIGKEFLRNATAAYAAVMAIEYDMSGYTNGNEAQVMIDILWSMAVEGVNMLRDQDYRTFVLSGALT